MDLEGIFSNVVDLFQVHTTIAIIIMAGLCLLFYFKPKPMFKMAATLMVFLAVFYIFSLFVGVTSTGYSQKVKMIDDVPKNDPSSLAPVQK